DGIVVSFGSEWHEALLKKRFKAVIRKRIPKTVQPRWLYFHINAPVSAACARAEICTIEDITRTQATSLRRDLALSEAEITAYLGSSSTIGCYKLGAIFLAKNDLPISEISKW